MEKQLALSDIRLTLAQALDLLNHFHAQAMDSDAAHIYFEQNSDLALPDLKQCLKQFLGLEDLEAYLEEHEFSFAEFSDGFEFCYLKDAEFGRQVSKVKTISSSTAGLYLIYRDRVCYVGPLGKPKCADYAVDVTGGIREAA